MSTPFLERYFHEDFIDIVISLCVVYFIVLSFYAGIVAFKSNSFTSRCVIAIILGSGIVRSFAHCTVSSYVLIISPYV